MVPRTPAVPGEIVGNAEQAARVGKDKAVAAIKFRLKKLTARRPAYLFRALAYVRLQTTFQREDRA